MERQPVSVIHADLEGKITYMSEGAEELFQYKKEELVGKERVSLFSPGLVVLEHVPRWLASSLRAGHYETDTVFIRKDGSQFAAHIRITPIIKQGVHTGYVGVTRPLPDRSPSETMPRISLTTKLLSWLYVTRAPFLTVTIIPVLLGAPLAQWLAQGSGINVVLMLLTLLGASLAHLAVNTANDYFDWKSGVDNINVDYVIPYSGGSRMIQLGVISARGMFLTSVVLFLAAAAVGAYIATVAGIWPETALLALLGGAIGILYTAPLVRLAARGLGELGIVLAFGPLLVAGTAAVQAGGLDFRAFLAGLPTGLLTGSIILANEFPDAAGDAAGGKRTLVVRLGLERARWAYILSWVLAYVSLVALVAGRALPVQTLAGLATLPLALYVTRELLRNYRSRGIKKAMAGTIYLHLTTGALMVLGAWLAV